MIFEDRCGVCYTTCRIFSCAFFLAVKAFQKMPGLRKEASHGLDGRIRDRCHTCTIFTSTYSTCLLLRCQICFALTKLLLLKTLPTSYGPCGNRSPALPSPNCLLAHYWRRSPTSTPILHSNQLYFHHLVPNCQPLNSLGSQPISKPCLSAGLHNFVSFFPLNDGGLFSTVCFFPRLD